MAKPYRRRDSKTPWWFTFSYRGHVYREAGGRTKLEAEERMRARIAEIKTGNVIPDHRRAAFTVSDLAKLWAERPKTKAKATAGADARRFATIVELVGANRHVDTLRRSDIDGPQGLIAKLTVRTRRSKTKNRPPSANPISPAEINRHLALLKAALRYAREQGYDHHDPMAGVKLSAESSRMRVATPKELAAIAQHSDPELRLAIGLALDTACRRNELADLEWAQVDLEGRRFRLRAADTKTKNERLVPLTRAAVAALEALPHRQGRVFATSGDSLSHRFAAACRAAKVPDLRFHDLRRTAATNLRRAGVDLLTVQRITGHKSLTMLQRYEAVHFDDTLAAVDRLSAHRK